jgi:hypothetical protein
MASQNVVDHVCSDGLVLQPSQTQLPVQNFSAANRSSFELVLSHSSSQFHYFRRQFSPCGLQSSLSELYSESPGDEIQRCSVVQTPRFRVQPQNLQTPGELEARIVASVC